MLQKVVIQKSDDKVLRFGYVDFANDGKFDSETEEIITHSFIFKSLDDCDYYYVGEKYWKESVGYLIDFIAHFEVEEDKISEKGMKHINDYNMLIEGKKLDII